MVPYAQLSANSRRAFDSDRRDYEAWCKENGRRLLPMTPALVVQYLLALEERGLTRPTIKRRLEGLRRLAFEAGGKSESMRAPYSDHVRDTMDALTQRIADA